MKSGWFRRFRTAASAVVVGTLFAAGAAAQDNAADVPTINQAINNALELNRSGEALEWTNSRTGNRGTVTPLQTVTDGGLPCREYERITITAGGSTTTMGSACRLNNGVWQVRNETELRLPVPETATTIDLPPIVPPAPETRLSRDQITEIQSLLARLGYDPGPADGLMGGRTGRAISAFQRDERLVATGTADEDVLAALRFAAANVPLPAVVADEAPPVPEPEVSTAPLDVIPVRNLGGGENVALVLDVSNSMWGQIDGVPKIQIAREAIDALLGDWQQDRAIGLVAYGHRREGDCSDIETVVPVGPLDRAQFMSRVNDLMPRGKTPLTEAVRAAAVSLAYQDQPATVVLVSDGIETCRADPCALAEELERSGVAFTAHVIGFDVVDPDERASLACIAENTGGVFVAADNAIELQTAFTQVVRQPALITLEALAAPDGPAWNDGLLWYVTARDGNSPVLDAGDMARPQLRLDEGRYVARVERAEQSEQIEFDVVGSDPSVYSIVLAEPEPEPVPEPIAAPEPEPEPEPIVVAQATPMEVYFQEEFDGPNLGKTWLVRDENVENYIVEDGTLLVIAQSLGDLRTDTALPTNLFELNKTLPSGDWQVSVRFTVDLQTTRDFLQFGLFEDSDNLLVSQFWAHCCHCCDQSLGSGLHMRIFKRSRGEDSKFDQELMRGTQNTFSDFAAGVPQPITVRLVKEGRTYRTMAHFEGQVDEAGAPVWHTTEIVTSLRTPDTFVLAPAQWEEVGGETLWLIESVTVEVPAE